MDYYEIIQNCYAGRWKIVEQALENLECCMYSCNGLIMSIACERGPASTVKNLIRLGYDVNYNEGAAICIASAAGRINLVKYLLTQGANIFVRKGTCLMNAVSGEHLNIVKILVKQGLKEISYIEKALDNAVEGTPTYTFLKETLRTLLRKRVIEELS